MPLDARAAADPNESDSARELREKKRVLAALVVHDLRSPLSALQGDNVVDSSESMPWYDGPPLLQHLETIELAFDRNLDARRFPVQWVIRPMSDEHHDYRGYAGQVAGGEWRAGDEVVVLPSGLRTTVASVETHDGPLDAAHQRLVDHPAHGGLKLAHRVRLLASGDEHVAA